MADPVTGTIAAISLATSAAGGIFGAMGAKEAAGAQENMYAYKAAVAQQNQQIAAQNAAYETQRGGVLAQRAGLEAAQKMGLITSAQAASGIDLNSGTASLVRTSQLEGAQTEQATVRSDAARRAYGFEVQGLNETQQAQLDIMSGKSVQAAAGYQEMGSLLGGASSVSDKWMKFSQQGVFSSGSGGTGLGSSFMGGGSPSGYGV